MFVHRRILLVAVLAPWIALPVAAIGQSTPGDDAAALEFFEKRIRPLLANNCYTCHSANTNSKGGLRVDDRAGLLHGGESGPAVVPGHPEQSLLVRAVGRTDEDLKMPPERQLTPDEVSDLARWIAEGAVWTPVELPPSLGEQNGEYETLRKSHWAWQPIREVGVPAVRGVAWVLDPVDAFLLSKLEENHLEPVGEADRAALVRRVTFDLTGLPPSPAEIDAFAGDTSADALSTLVDRLLASPAFGERWGRHWLDVARFGESTGSSRNLPYPHAWRYRDYVIRAFNDDKPYDQFIREQVAGDLLPAESDVQREEQLIATGFLALGVKDVNQRFKVRFVMDNVDEQIDAVTRGVLALTASCARCHDHKFDPIPTSDYYALAGIFHSTDLCAGLRNKMGGGGLDYYDTSMLLRVGPELAPDAETQKKIVATEKAVELARAEFEALRGKPEGNEPSDDGRPKRAVARQKLNRLQNEFLALNDPAARGGNAALGVRDSQQVGDTEIRIRGQAEQLGPVVPRGFLSVLELADQPQVNPAQSGRLELADWLTSNDNALTPRVMVNRVWHHLFGKGLVTSVDNFGVTGDVPSHPELLDYLAARFVRDGWSVKKLVRALVLSRAYRLGSAATEANLAADPGNRLVWRHAPRRLDAEEIRDATLVAAGNLDPIRPEASPAKNFKVVELRDNGPEAKRLRNEARTTTYRSVYLPVLRGLTPTAFEVFDFAEQGMVSGQRDTTTVAPQALYLLNDPFVLGQSMALAERLFERSDLDDAGRIAAAYRWTLGRAATSQEIERARAYLADYESTAADLNAALASATRPDQAVVAVGIGPDFVAVDSSPTTAEQTSAKTTNKPKGKKKTKVAAQDSDEGDVDAGDSPEETVSASSAKAAAWATFCQALLGSAEFRYLK